MAKRARRGRAGGARPLVFLWENIGPTHADRLRAAAATGRPVVAIQYTARSHTYDWTGAAADGFALRTLFPGACPGGWRLAVRLIRALWREGPADLFLCHYEQGAVWLAATLMRLAGRRVFALFESKFDDYPRRLLRELGKAVLLRPYHGALTGGFRSRDYLRFLGLTPDRIALGYATLSIDRIRAQAGAPPAPDGVGFAGRDFVAVARLVPKKNLFLALDAYARWRAETGGARRLHLCGSGPEEAALRARAAALGVADGVRFHGFVQTDAISRVLARALCLLLPSTEEQFGLAVIEAQAMGVPVLLSTNAGAADRLVRPGLDGLLLPPHGPDAWAAAMALVSEDEGRWRRWAAAAGEAGAIADARHFAEGVLALAG